MQNAIIAGTFAATVHGFGGPAFAENTEVAKAALEKRSGSLCQPTGEITTDGPYVEIRFTCANGDSYEVDTEVYDGKLIAEYIEHDITYADIPAAAIKAAQGHGAHDLTKCGVFQKQTELATDLVTWEFDDCNDGTLDIEVADGMPWTVFVDVHDQSRPHYAEHTAVAKTALEKFANAKCTFDGRITLDDPYVELQFDCDNGHHYEVDTEVYDGELIAEYIEHDITYADIPAAAIKAAQGHGVQDLTKCGLFQEQTELANGAVTWEFDECNDGALDIEVADGTWKVLVEADDKSHRTAH